MSDEHAANQPANQPAGAPARAASAHMPWLVLGVAFGASFAQIVFFNPILGVFVTPLSEEFGWSRAEISASVTIGGIGAGLASPWIGRYLDRRGARRVVPPAALLMVCCLLALARLDALWQLYVFYALGRGLTIGVVSAAVVVVLSNWFVRRRSFAIAIAIFGQRLGMATLPALVAAVIALAGDWRAGWVVLAVVMLVLGVVPFLFVPRRPEDVGLLPDGDATAEQAFVEESWSLGEAMRTRAYWAIGLSTTLAVASGGTVNFHQIPHLEGQGLASTSAALVVTVFSLFSAAGGLVGGWLGTRVRARWLLAGALALQGVALVLLIVAESVPGAMLYAAAYGSCFGVMFTTLQVIHADYFGRESLGAIRGSMQPVTLTANAVSPFLAGLWYDVAGSYDAVFAVLVVGFLLAAVALLFARYPERPAER